MHDAPSPTHPPTLPPTVQTHHHTHTHTPALPPSLSSYLRIRGFLEECGCTLDPTAEQGIVGSWRPDERRVLGIMDDLIAGMPSGRDKQTSSRRIAHSPRFDKLIVRHQYEPGIGLLNKHHEQLRAKCGGKDGASGGGEEGDLEGATGVGAPRYLLEIVDS